MLALPYEIGVAVENKTHFRRLFQLFSSAYYSPGNESAHLLTHLVPLLPMITAPEDVLFRYFIYGLSCIFESPNGFIQQHIVNHLQRSFPFLFLTSS